MKKLYAYMKFRNGKEVSRKLPDNFMEKTSLIAIILTFIIGIPLMFLGIYIIQFTYNSFLKIMLQF
jgi:hypothetical protein